MHTMIQGPKPFALISVLLFLFSLSPVFGFEVTAQEDEFYREKGYVVLNGEQDGEYPKAVYLITQKVTVPPEKTMILHPGSILLFKKDTRIIVRGELICRGAETAEITLGKLDNQKYYFPLAPELETRWDGLFLEESATLEAAFTTISQSKYGITASANHGAINLESVTFIDNKFHDIRVADAKVDYSEGHTLFERIEPGGTPTPPVPPEPERRAVPQWKIAASIGSGAVVAGGVILAALFHNKVVGYENEYNDLTDGGEIAAVKQKRKSALIGRGVGLGLAVLGAGGVTVTILF